MTRLPTIREHLNRSFDLSVDYHKLSRDDLIVLARQMQEQALDALALLEASARVDYGPLAGALECFRLVPDPDVAGGV